MKHAWVFRILHHFRFPVLVRHHVLSDVFKMNRGFEIACACAFTVLCIISARIYWLLNKAYIYWDKKKVNGPLPRYIFGNWYGIAEKFVGSEDYANISKYGKICGTYDGLTPNLLVTDPKIIKEILNAPINKLQDIRFASESSVILKDSLLSLSDGHDQKRQTLISSLLSPNKFNKLIPKLESSIEILSKNILDTRQENGLVNITSSVKNFIDEIIALGLFGIELNADVEFKEQFVKNTEQILKIKSPESIWSLLPFLYESYFKEPWVCPEKVLQYFVNLIISGMSETTPEDNTTEAKSSNLIELMVEAAKEEKKLIKKEEENENAESVLTDSAVISECIASMLSLASLTRTSVVLGIYALSNEEEVQEKLFKEIEENKFKITSYEDIQNLDYLDKVVKEVLRLYPFEFRIERVTVDDIKLGDIELDKKVRVSIPLYVLHRLEEYYPEPDKFDPERFSRSALEKRDPYTYLPFGQAGCNGSDISFQLGVLASKLALFRLVQNFKFSIPQKLSLHKLFHNGFTRVPQPEQIEVFAESRI